MKGFDFLVCMAFNLFFDNWFAGRMEHQALIALKMVEFGIHV